MKFTIDSSTLAGAIEWAQKSIKPRPTEPILSGIMITADAGELTLSGFDGTTASISVVAAYVDAPGQCLVPASMFAGIIKALPRGKQMHVEVEEKLSIKCGTAKFTIQTIPTANYPTLPLVPEKVGTISGDTFAKASGMVSYAVSTDLALPVLTAVKMEIGPRLSIMATDRYRLTYANSDWNPVGNGEFTALIPAAVVDNVARMSAGDIEVFASETLVGFKCGNRTTVTTLLAGEYPNIMPLFPDSSAPTVVRVPIADLVEVLSRADYISDKKRAVKLEFREDSVTVYSGTVDTALGKESIDAEMIAGGGEPLVVAFNVGYLLEALKSLTTEQVEFGFQINVAKPAVVREPDSFDAQQLVMPVRLDAV